MSLPKRDGVHSRYYLVHKRYTSPEVLAQADLCIHDVQDGSSKVIKVAPAQLRERYEQS